MTTTNAPPTPHAARAANVQRTIHAYFAATRAMDREAWVACFAEDGCTIDPVGTAPVRGREGLRLFFDGIVGLASTIGLMETGVHVCGDQAAIAWIGRGVGKANGKPFVFEGVDVMSFDAHGKIRELHAYWDPARLMAQLA